MNVCPRHPDGDTMVPCMKCGRNYCRICESAGGSTHYCNRCGESSVDQIRRRSAPKRGFTLRKKAPVGEARQDDHGVRSAAGKQSAPAAKPGLKKGTGRPSAGRGAGVEEVRPYSREAVGPRTGAPGGAGRDTRRGSPPGTVAERHTEEAPPAGAATAERRRGRPDVKRTAPEKAGGTGAGPVTFVEDLKDIAGMPRRAIRRIAVGSAAAWKATREKARAMRPGRLREALEERVEERQEEREERWEETEDRRFRKRAMHGRKRELKRERRVSTLEGIRERMKRAAIAAALFLPRKLVELARFVWRAFPVGIVEKEVPGAKPPFKEKWKKLALLALGGTALWVILVAISRSRWPGWGYLIGVLIGAGFVLALDLNFSRDTGIAAGMSALVSILTGEAVVLVLYRLKILKDIGISGYDMAKASSGFGYMLYFFWWFVMIILVPSVLIAFAIGLWPLPVRLYWRGFRSE